MARLDYWWWFINPDIEKITPEESIFFWQTEDEQIASQVAPEGWQVVLVADVPLGSENSIYARYGDWLGWLCLVGAFGFTITSAVISVKQRKYNLLAHPDLHNKPKDVNSTNHNDRPSKKTG